jgi:hypothetical protein
MRVPKCGHPSIMGHKNKDMKNSDRRTVAFHTSGPMAMTAIRIRGLGGSSPFTGKDLTNIYATMNRVAAQIGKITSDRITDPQLARGTSPDSFSEGWPNRFLLYPVIIVRDNLQYPYQLLFVCLELPRDIQRKNSR